MTTAAALQQHKVVTQEEWLKARKELLAAEKEFTRQRDALSAKRRELPWVRLTKNYVFDGPNGQISLADLFRGKSQLVVYHFMLGPDWKEGCPSCSFLGDHFDGAIPHLSARDVTFTAISRAPMEQIAAFKKRMGWKFNWVSSNKSDFNFDFHVSFTKDQLAKKQANYNFGTIQEFGSEEGPGLSVFYRVSGSALADPDVKKNAAGEIFHTYSTYARGLDILLGAYNFLDFTPKGRDEDGLAFSMSWVRHHDRYAENYAVDPNATYQPPAKTAGGACCSEHS